MALCPSPASCGNTNHIQWLVLRPSASSRRTCARTGSWAVTKRSRSNSSGMVRRCSQVDPAAMTEVVDDNGTGTLNQTALLATDRLSLRAVQPGGIRVMPNLVKRFLRQVLASPYLDFAWRMAFRIGFPLGPILGGLGGAGDEGALGG